MKITPFAVEIYSNIRPLFVFSKTKWGHVIRSWPKPSRNQPTKWQLRQQAYMTLSAAIASQMKGSAIAWYAQWAATSQFTWKDQLISRLWIHINASGVTPICVTNITASITGTDLSLTWETIGYRVPVGYGYGSLGYGNSPYGHPGDMATENGWKPTYQYSLAIAQEWPRPTPKGI